MLLGPRLPLQGADQCREFLVRFAPGLASKPKGPKRDGQAHVDPFENPDPDLFIADLSIEHFLVLNKFPVMPQHFILATKEFKEQTHLLEPNDLAAAFDCVRAYAATGRRLFAFFNSGEESGASQPHRHIQFVPEDTQQIKKGESGWLVLADKMLHAQYRDQLPFRVFVEWLGDLDADTLHAMYLSLFTQAFSAINDRKPTTDEFRGAAGFSYNLAMTRDTMVLCPRVTEGAPLVDERGQVRGHLSLNGTLLSGSVLVKTEEERKFLIDDEAALKRVLVQACLPPRESKAGGN